MKQLEASSHTSASFFEEPNAARPKAIEYLNKGKEGKESVRDFINFQRQILMAQISINSKNEENERLLEYITMEQEKLAEAKNILEEDNAKMRKLMKDAEEEMEHVQTKVKEKISDKQKLTKEIEKISNEIFSKDGLIKKNIDDLEVFKNYKHFLDIMSM